MSRKSEIFEIGDMLALGQLTEWDAVEAAYDLGRASVLESMRKTRTYGSADKLAKRLRAHARKLTGSAPPPCAGPRT